MSHKSEILPGKTYEEKLCILENLRRSSRSLADTVQYSELIEDVKKYHREEEEYQAKKESFSARLRKMELLTMQKRFAEARMCFNEFHDISYQLNEEDSRKLAEALNKIVQGEKENPALEPMTLSQIIQEKQESPKISSTDSQGMDMDKLTLREENHTDNVKKDSQMPSSNMEDTASLNHSLQEKNQSLNAQNEELQKKCASLEKENLTLQTLVERANHSLKLTAYIIAHIYLDNPAYLPSDLQERVKLFVEQKSRTHRFNTGLVSNIAQTILENADTCLAPYSQLFQTGEET